jgi:serine/threonine protein kinase
MNCNNINCKKHVRNYNICETCSSIFCSSTCLNEHKRDAHGNSLINIVDNVIPRYSLSKSLFLKQGIYEKEIIDDPHFDFANFEFVKSERKKSLGHGAFGEVYLATNKIDNKLYAIKVMEKEKIIESGASLDIIHREISIHRKINQENIVKVYSHFENDKFFYLIMEYVNGGSLFSIIKKNKGIDEKKAFKYFIQACSAVNFLHVNNLIHRDLKPENILINDKEVVKLCDFGWCVDISNGNRVTFCGTYEYMAPEIVKELPYNFEIDVWSLGILLYELTHGYSPFRAEKEDGEDYHEIFTNIIKYKFKIEKDLSKGCIDLIQSKNPFGFFYYCLIKKF